jgi:hypothetical protein
MRDGSKLHLLLIKTGRGKNTFDWFEGISKKGSRDTNIVV